MTKDKNPPQSIQKINAALDTVNWAYHCYCKFTNENIYDIFKDGFSLNSGFQFRGETLSFKRAENIRENHIISSIACLFIALDEALKDTFEPRKPKDLSKLGKLRTVIYLLRCTFAHDICEPKWDIRGQYLLLEPISIPIHSSLHNTNALRELSFDFKKLHGHRLKKGRVKFCVLIT